MFDKARLIAHRGNVFGPSIGNENSLDLIQLAIDVCDYDCEVDLWAFEYENLFLGHDHPQWMVSREFLSKYSDRLWIHAKNLEALEFCLLYGYHCFWHENDQRVLTSRGFIWTYPGQKIGPMSVLVCLDPTFDLTEFKGYAVCGDYIGKWSRSLSA